MKTCKKCKKELDMDMFAVHPKTRDGHVNICGWCKSEYDKKYYTLNRARKLKKVNEYRERNIDKLRKYITRYNNGEHAEELLANGVCEKCGTDKKLCIHHKDNRGQAIPPKERNNNINNLMVLCRSCHMRLHRITKH